MYLSFDRQCAHSVLPLIFVPVPSAWLIGEDFNFDLIISITGMILSAQRDTILLIVPVDMGILKPPPSISWVRFTLTAPIVFRDTASA